MSVAVPSGTASTRPPVPPPPAPAAGEVAVVGTGSDDGPARRCSPISRGVVARWFAWWAVLSGTCVAAGLGVVHALPGTALARWDAEVPRWFERERTPALDEWSHAASMISDTSVKVASVVVLGTVFVGAWKRWHDAWMLTGAMLLEVAAFATAANLVGRERPAVEQLDGSLPTSSFPSGHVAAAAAFGLALAVIAWWHTERRWIRVLAGAQAVVVPIVVAVSRVYRGMHHPTDVVAGALLGVAATLVVRSLLRRGVDDLVARAARDGRTVPARAAALSQVDGLEEVPMVEVTERGSRAGEAPGDDDVGSEDLEEHLRENPRLVAFMRVGWVAKAIVYGVMGAVAFAAATGGGVPSARDDQASPRGAVEKVAESGAGAVLVSVLAVGLAIYALWRIVTVLLPADNDAHAWAHRAGYAASAVTYGVLAWSAVSLAQAGGSGGQDDEDATVTRVVADVMSRSGGRWLVGLVGVAFLVVGAYFARKAVQRTFEDELEHRGVGAVPYRWIVRLGVAGWLARAVTMALVAVFLVRAAVTYDPEQAEGLDDALRRTAGSTLGGWLVAVTGLGLVVYALFCVVSAPRQRLRGA